MDYLPLARSVVMDSLYSVLSTYLGSPHADFLVELDPEIRGMGRTFCMRVIDALHHFVIQDRSLEDFVYGEEYRVVIEVGAEAHEPHRTVVYVGWVFGGEDANLRPTISRRD